MRQFPVHRAMSRCRREWTQDSQAMLDAIIAPGFFATGQDARVVSTLPDVRQTSGVLSREIRKLYGDALVRKEAR
ncbi:MAG: hypothetical protein FWD57_12335 [Polyangiaceae bacterium]|nr:hypothetical protein [Polyangiaceae bacterium]